MDKLANMDNLLNGKVISKEDTVKKVVEKLIQRNRAGLKILTDQLEHLFPSGTTGVVKPN